MLVTADQEDDGRSMTHLEPPGVNKSQVVIMMHGSFVQFFQTGFCCRGSAAIFLHLTVDGSLGVRLLPRVSLCLSRQ